MKIFLQNLNKLNINIGRRLYCERRAVHVCVRVRSARVVVRARRRRAVGMVRGRAGARTHTAARRPIAAPLTRTPPRTRYVINLVFLRKSNSFCARLGCRHPRAHYPPSSRPPFVSPHRRNMEKKNQKYSHSDRRPPDFNKFSAFFLNFFPGLFYIF